MNRLGYGLGYDIGCGLGCGSVNRLGYGLGCGLGHGLGLGLICHARVHCRAQAPERRYSHALNIHKSSRYFIVFQ